MDESSRVGEPAFESTLIMTPEQEIKIQIFDVLEEQTNLQAAMQRAEVKKAALLKTLDEIRASAKQADQPCNITG